MRFENPSRSDARELTRNEKTTLTFLTNALSALAETKDGLADRMKMLDKGPETIERLVKEALDLLNEIRTTIPEKQRINLVNTAKDFEIRLVPKFTPTNHNVLVPKEEFRTLVNSAQARCKECAEDNESCKACDLYQLLTVVLPMDDYKWHNLCPYVAEWAN